jgi:gamma-glutamylaminecyclotransferase
MRGEPDHAVLKGARFLGEVRTAPEYRMHSVNGQHPAVYRVDADGVVLEGELYDLPASVRETLLAQEPPNLYEADIILEDGTVARAMYFPRELVEANRYIDISEHGSWPAYKKSLR